MIVIICVLFGQQLCYYFGDSYDLQCVVVCDLKEEILCVFCVCVVNFKWLVSICCYGYKGGFELMVIVDYLFGYDVIV